MQKSYATGAVEGSDAHEARAACGPHGLKDGLWWGWHGDGSRHRVWDDRADCVLVKRTVKRKGGSMSGRGLRDPP